MFLPRLVTGAILKPLYSVKFNQGLYLPCTSLMVGKLSSLPEARNKSVVPRLALRYYEAMKKRLERSDEQVVIAGVLAGMADYFKQDPALFRIVAIAFLLLTGIFPGLLIYLVAWIVMPKRSRTADYEVT